MLGRRLTRVLFSTTSTGKKQVIPKPPKFLSGELQPFKYQFQNAQLYEGYSYTELYGAKFGAKNPPAVRAQMTKDTIASSLILIIGFGVVYHLNNMFKQELKGIDRVQDTKLSKKVVLPENISPQKY